MAFNPAPEFWIEDYDVADGVIQIPIASIANLDGAKADPTTGDIREVLYRLAAAMQTKQDSLSAGDRPAEMTLQKGQSLNSDLTMTRAFTQVFITDTGDLPVEDEP